MRGWYFETRKGRVEIRHVVGRWCIFFGDDNLGSYHSPSAAADDAAGGHTFTPSNGVDLGRLGIPENIDEWSPINP